MQRGLRNSPRQPWLVKRYVPNTTPPAGIGLGLFGVRIETSAGPGPGIQHF